MNKKYLALLLSVSALALSGCTLGFPKSGVEEVNNSAVESPVKTLTGVLKKSGEVFSLAADNGDLTEVTSRKVNLDGFVDKKITVVGEFSGTTLFVDQIKP